MHLCQEQLVLRPFQTRSAPYETRRRKTSFWHTRSILLCNNTIRAPPCAAKKNTDQPPTWSDESNFHVKLLAPSRALVKPPKKREKKSAMLHGYKKYLAFYFLMQHNRLSYSIISAYFCTNYRRRRCLSTQILSLIITRLVSHSRSLSQANITQGCTLPKGVSHKAMHSNHAFLFEK